VQLAGDGVQVVADHHGAADLTAQAGDLPAQPVGVGVQCVSDQQFVADGDDSAVVMIHQRPYDLAVIILCADPQAQIERGGADVIQIACRASNWC